MVKIGSKMAIFEKSLHFSVHFLAGGFILVFRVFFSKIFLKKNFRKGRAWRAKWALLKF